MKSVLIAIRPQLVEKICHKIGEDETGKAIYEKRIEVRKSAPKEVPFKAYIYETQGRTETPWIDEDGHFIYKGRGQVIGAFICDRIEMVNAKCSDYGIDLFYHDCLTNGCLTEREIEKYFNVPEDRDLRAMKGNGYVWNISDLKIYDKPRELNEFSRPCSYSGLCFSCKRTSFKKDGNLLCNTKITRPPQSWMHVEDLGEEE